MRARMKAFNLTPEKQKVMHISRSIEGNIQVDGETLENIEHYQYLGLHKSTDTLFKKIKSKNCPR